MGIYEVTARNDRVLYTFHVAADSASDSRARVRDAYPEMYPVTSHDVSDLLHRGIALLSVKV